MIVNGGQDGQETGIYQGPWDRFRPLVNGQPGCYSRQVSSLVDGVALLTRILIGGSPEPWHTNGALSSLGFVEEQIAHEAFKSRVNFLSRNKKLNSADKTKNGASWNHFQEVARPQTASPTAVPPAPQPSPTKSAHHANNAYREHPPGSLMLRSINLLPFGVLGNHVSNRGTLSLVPDGTPDSETVIVDPANPELFKDPEARLDKAGGASGAIYKWLGMAKASELVTCNGDTGSAFIVTTVQIR